MAVTLFLCAINGIVDQVELPVKVLLYADDLTIYTTHKTAQNAVEILQRSIDKIFNWTELSGFKISPEKCSFVHFTHKRVQHIAPRLYLNGNEIKKKNSHKFLGLHFDSKLTWSTHIAEVVKSCLSRTRILKMLANKKFGTDISTLMTLYKSYILPKIDYGCAVYASAKDTVLKKLDIIQNQCLRIASGAFRTSPIISLQICTGTTSLDIRRQTFTLKAAIDILYKKYHPTNHLYRKETLIDDYNRKTQSTKPLVYRAQLLAENINFTLPIVPEQQIYQEKPPWTLKTCSINLSLTKFKKTNTNPIIFKQLYSNLIHQHTNYTPIYTDGSKQLDFVGCAYVYMDQII